MERNYESITPVQNIADQLCKIESGSFMIRAIIPSSQKAGQDWRYMLHEPTEGWEKKEYDDNDWKIGKGGFGDPKNSNPVIRTKWENQEL